MPHGTFLQLTYLGLGLSLGRVDALSMVFAHVFAIQALIGFIYALHVEDRWQHVAACLYIAGAFGCAFAGDYVTLFIFWELMSVSSTFLIWLRRVPASTRAGMRYFLFHAMGGLFLLAGLLLRYQATGTFAFEAADPGAARLWDILIMLGFCVNAAVDPPARLAAGRLPRSHRNRCRVHERLYHQDRGLRPAARIFRIRDPGDDGHPDDHLRGRLRHHREQRPAHPGLPHRLAGGLHGGRRRGGHGHDHQRGLRACLCPHPLQGAAVHGRGGAAPRGRHGQALGAGRPVPAPAVGLCLVHGGGGEHLRLSAVLGVRQQDHDHHRRGRSSPHLARPGHGGRRRRHLLVGGHQAALLRLVRPTGPGAWR